MVGELVQACVVVGAHARHYVDVAEEEAGLDHEVNCLKMLIVAVCAEVGWHHHPGCSGIVASQSIWTPGVEEMIRCVFAYMAQFFFHFSLSLLANATLLAGLLSGAAGDW